MLRGRAAAVGHGPQHRLPHAHSHAHLPPQRPKQKGHQLQQQQQVQTGAAQVVAALPPSVPQPPQQQPQATNAVTAASSLADFPNCANDVLSKIGDFVRQWGAQPQHKGWNRTKQKELQKCIDADLFCLSSDPSRRGQSRLNHLQRLRLLGIVCTYFSKSRVRLTRRSVTCISKSFSVGERAHLHEARVHFLVKLCSLATQYPVYGLFEHVAHWVRKVTRDELKCAYMEQIVAELVDGFVMTATNRRLHEFLLPLADHSMEFCANFLTFAITSDSLGPALGELIGHWLCERIEKFVHVLRQNPYIGQLFCANKFNLLLRYDSTNSCDDDIHHRLHFVLLKFAVVWGSFKETPKIAPFRPKVNCLLEIFKNELNTLSPLGEQRLVENIIKSYRGGFIQMEPFRTHFESPAFSSQNDSSEKASHWAMLKFALFAEQRK
ncbi:hypothetical protein niasHT_013462 [Heterodera trifolii]|uniref:Uncharacterized protein n=1 Tax=Heterodera trifolii TaxID=157864 RepID=A0ABD2LCN7_9BILA